MSWVYRVKVTLGSKETEDYLNESDMEGFDVFFMALKGDFSFRIITRKPR